MVKRVFNFVYQEVRGLHQAAYILALFAFGSQILAIVRDRLLAHTFGAGSELDLYYAAFRIPDLLFVLFASVLSIYVLLPFVSRYNAEKDSTGGVMVLSQMFTLFLYLYILVAVILAATAPWYVPKIFPGFAGEYDSLILMLRILLLQPFLLGLSSLCGVVTQMNHRFVLYALSPLLYNLGIILGIVVFYQLFDLIGLIMGVVIGALGHLMIQVPFIKRSEYSFRLVPKIKWSLVKKVLAVSIPRALTLSVNQVVLLVFIGMASVMSVGSVSVFQFAFNLQSVPLAIVGMSYSVAAFPSLSNLHAKKDKKGFNLQIITALRHIIFWSMPIIGLMIVLRAQIVRVLLGSGEFDWGDTRLTAAILALFVISLVAQATLLLLVRAFYAGGQTAIPLVVSLISGVTSVGLAFLFQSIYVNNLDIQTSINELLRLTDVAGAEVLVLALAFMIGQFVQLILLLAISNRVFSISYVPLVKILLQATLAAVVGAVAAYITLSFVVNGINQDTFVGILIQGVTAGVVGLMAVVMMYALTGSKELKEIVRSFQAKIFNTDVIAPQ